MITRRTVVQLGLSQLIAWGVSYYLIGGFAAPIAADLGWSPALVHGGFSAALLAMGLVSPLAGRLIDRHGGRPVMAEGSCLMALGCAGLALATTLPAYYAAWLVLGLAMRLSLYEAAFAALARIGGPAARRPMAQITLLGGLASTVFWPLGSLLATQLGWRGALLAYAGLALLTLPLHLALPRGRHVGPAAGPAASLPAGAARGDLRLAAILYALTSALVNGFNSGLSAHMIGVLAGLGLGSSLAVWISSLRGLGQSSARLGEVLLGRRLHPLDLNLLAAALLPLAFAAGLLSGRSLPAAIAFALLYGAGNGLMTITRGTLPLVLFDPRSYGSLTGRLLAPGFILAALAPLAFALLIQKLGAAAALWLSLALSALTLAAAIALRIRFRWS